MDAYLYGQVLGTHSFYLRDGFVQQDEYSELSAKYFLPGGETGSAATVLASLGVSVKLDGTHIGTEVGPMLKEFYKNKSVDLSSLKFDPNYTGLMDYVLVAELSRTPMGFFQSLYQQGIKRWNIPNEQDVIDCKVAAVDPFFQEESEKACELCVKHHKPYVTIDCRHDTYYHQHAEINVVSKECSETGEYKGKSKEEIYKLLTQTTDGLVIITTGEKDMIWGRRGEPAHHTKPFSVDVKSTLGAGDTFKAGCVYGLLKGMHDEEIVRFASACSAVAISRYPLPLYPPTLQEVEILLKKN